MDPYLEWTKAHEAELYRIIKARVEAHQADRISEARSKANSQIDYEDAYHLIRATRTQQPHVLVTINPRPEVTLAELQDLVQSSCERYFDRYRYVFEIRKAPDQGIHCHIVAHRKKHPDPNFNRFSHRFQTIVGNPKHVDIKFLPSNEVPKAISYIMKSEVSPSKQAAYDATIQWRTDNDVEEFYDSDDPLTCLSSVSAQPVEESYDN